MMKNKQDSGLRRASRRRQFRRGWYSILLTILVVAAIAVVNIVITSAEDKWALRIDASPNSITEFSDQTYKALDELEQDIHIYLLFTKGDTSQLRTQLEEITAKFKARSSRVIVDTIDPITEPNRVNKYKSSTSTQNMTNGSMIVTNADETRVRLIPQSEIYSHTQDQTTGQYQKSSFNGESKLTQGILFVTSDSTPIVYFLTGHDEVPATYCANMTQVLQADNFEVKDLQLGSDTELRTGDTVMIIMPQLDMTEAEYQQLKTFLDNGGRMVFASDPSVDMKATPTFTKLLDYYGIQFKDGLVVEDQNSSDNWLLQPNYIVPNLNTEHQITSAINGARLVLLNPRALTTTAMPLSGWSYQELLTTSDKAYIKGLTSDSDILTKDANDEVGRQVLAIAVSHSNDATDKTKDTRIIAIGSPYTFVSSEFYTTTHNPLFTYSMFDWLVDRENNTYIRGKALANTLLSIPNQSTYLMLSALVLIVLPLVVLLCGVFVYLKRRRL